jgi:acyl dehydratase
VIVVAAPEDLTSRVGDHLGWSDWHPVTQEAVDAFAAATGNTAPVHTDPDWARASTPYGGAIAFGMQIQAMFTLLMNDVWQLRVSGGVDVGSNKVRHLAPVVVPGRVRVGATVVAADPVEPNGVRLTLELTFEVEGAERPACVAEIVFIYYF